MSAREGALLIIGWLLGFGSGVFVSGLFEALRKKAMNEVRRKFQMNEEELQETAAKIWVDEIRKTGKTMTPAYGSVKPSVTLTQNGEKES